MEVAYYTKDDARLPQAERDLSKVAEILDRHPTIEEHQQQRLETLKRLPSQMLELFHINISSPAAEEEYTDQVGQVLDGLSSGGLNLYEVSQDRVSIGNLSKNGDVPMQPGTLISVKALMDPNKYVLRTDASGNWSLTINSPGVMPRPLLPTT
jgi:hypothetical protein